MDGDVAVVGRGIDLAVRMRTPAKRSQDRRLPYSAFLRHFGIKTYVVLALSLPRLKLANSSTQSLLEVCVAAHLSAEPDELPLHE